MPQYQLLGLDIGSSSIKAVIAEQSPRGKIMLRGGFIKPSNGIRRGVIVDMEAATSTIRSLLDDVKNISKNAAKNIYLRVGGSDVKIQTSRGITAVARANSEIHRDDIERVIQASEAVNMPQNRMILHNITQEYIVDGVGEVHDPLGMTGSRLEVTSLIIDAFQPSIQNISKCVELAGGSIGALIFGPIASALSVLTTNQKELGVVSVDIGYGTTGIAVYEEGKLLHTKVIPIGAGHITNDLAIALKISVEAAEKIKLTYGCALAREVSAKDKIDIKSIDENGKGTPSRKFVAEVIESRLGELCEFINDELHVVGKDKRLPAGAVITGGGAKLQGVVDLAREKLKLSTQIGLPQESLFEPDSRSSVDFLESPEYAAVLGLALWSGEISPRRVQQSGRAMGVLKKFLP